MANECWYELKVRPGFGSVVAQKLRKLNLEVIVPDQKSIQEPHLRELSIGHLYCRLDLDNHLSVSSIPGVMGILGPPRSSSFDKGMASFQAATYV